MSCGYGNICTNCNRCGKLPAPVAVAGKKRVCFGCGNEPPAAAKHCPVCGRKLPPPLPPPPGVANKNPVPRQK